MIIVVVVTMICAMIVIIIIIIVVVYCIKKDKYPCINEGKLFYICSCIHTYNVWYVQRFTIFILNWLYMYPYYKSLYHELQQTLLDAYLTIIV